MTTGAQRAEERSLCGHREFGRRIGKRSVDARREGLVVAAHLDGEGALADGGDDLVGIERRRGRARQGGLNVPTSAPAGSCSNDGYFSEQKTSRGSSRGPIAASRISDGSALGRSLHEWTA